MPTEGIGIMMLVLQDDLDTRALAEELRASQAVLREVHCLVETKFQDLFDEVQLEMLVCIFFSSALFPPFDLTERIFIAEKIRP
jgi:hypothetical protein